VTPRQQRSKTLTSHGHAADSTGATEINNRGGGADRTGIIFPQPRDPYHRPRMALVTGCSSEAGRHSTTANRGQPRI
jgi:hypothetical protein